ncbi:MAG: AraC family transcriptional regulator [Cytophagaceae bacterium]|nr:AraC family transcriptional regulator [Cytophagaceae bacterium]
MTQKELRPSPAFMANLKQKGFVIIEIEPNAKGFADYTRRDFYKIALVKGKARVTQANENIILDGTYLRFSTPYLPYSSEVLSDKWEGYACYFLEEFLYPGHRMKTMQKSPLFRIGAAPAVKLHPGQNQAIADIFKKMLAEQQQGYAFKDDVIRSYINLLIHESLKIDASLAFKPYQKAPIKITAGFLDLLEEQYPVVSPLHSIKMLTAKHFADGLSVHVNYLNRMVKNTTGKTTSEHIADRIVKEAAALLTETDWNISEIAHALGFGNSNYFSTFFKKQLGITPRAFRSK